MTATTAIRAAALVTVTALAAACQPAEEESAAPTRSPSTAPSVSAAAEVAPTTATPSPPTAANTATVCAAVDKLIIDKSKEIAADSAAATRNQLTPEQINAEVKGDLADLADDVRAQAGKATDPEIKALVRDAAQKIDAGARSSTPVKWLSSSFVQIPQRLSRECRP